MHILLFIFILIHLGLSPVNAENMVLIHFWVFKMGGELEADQTPIHEVYLDFFYILISLLI